MSIHTMPQRARAGHPQDRRGRFASFAGFANFANFANNPPSAAAIVDAVPARYAQYSKGRAPTIAEIQTAVGLVLDRAYTVAWFLRGASARGNLQWIAVSAEDDFPHRPVNVPATKYPQFDAYLAVLPTISATKAIVLKTRYTIATATVPVPPPLMFGSANPPVPVPRVLPPLINPALPPTGGIILYIHGSDSRLEEAELVMPPLVGTPAAPTGFSVISVDLPGSGYVTPIDPDEVGALTPDFPAIGNPGFIYDVVLMPFLERFIIEFLNAGSAELGQTGMVQGRLVAVMGGSLGGNMALRLGRHPSLFPNVIAYSAGSVWDSFFGVLISLNARICDVPYQAQKIGPQGGSLAAALGPAGIESFVEPNARAQFFNQAFDQQLLPVVNPHTQPDQWYRDGWPCKSDFINGARLDRWETYNPAARRWHWRISLEELIFSWVRPFGGPSPAGLAGAYVGTPAYQEIKSRLLLGAGKADNYEGASIFSNTTNLANQMVGNNGDTFFFDQTGHSIHAERPVALANKILAFLPAPAVAAPSVVVGLASVTRYGPGRR